MKIYVGNLSYDVTESELRAEFESFGEVTSVDLVVDKYTGRPRGFGFIEMPAIPEGQAAVNGLNGKMLKDRTLDVNPAKERPDKRGGAKSYGNNKKKGGGFSKGKSRRF